MPRLSDQRPRASPLARRIADRRGIDLAEVRGSGHRGRVVKADVEAVARAQAAAAPVPTQADSHVPEGAKGAVEALVPSRSQALVARRMAESKATAPHFHLQAEIEMSAAATARERLGATLGDEEPVPSFDDMVVKAAALALRELPAANGSYRDGRFELHSRVNVGIAVAAADALLVPTIFDADRKGLGQIAAESRALAARAREGAVTEPELADGTFSISSLGMFGASSFQAVVDPPQAAILAVGQIAERPVVRDGALAAGRVMAVTLSCDHRILYGAEGARFLARIRELLEEPLLLLAC